ncbi:NLR family CARD domain-containing protein 4 [Armadillidium nasatum]|uniref:NLR family CARD domain-containing protein 4 n=1 Tax=Armadillidium nasatum TaxID=96803 RepID=A0A5N5TCR2_9CRUS|nr:NLR family CARD domain-containing protein 4 [Armadillidium nasatum]
MANEIQREDDEVFCTNYTEIDATILAMCDDGTEEQQQYQSFSSGNMAPPTAITDSSPFSFGMEGSTINISHSKDIHFGPKTVAPPSFISHTNSPVINEDAASSRYYNSGEDGFSITSSMTSLNSNHYPPSFDPRIRNERVSSPYPQTEERIFPENFPSDRVPSSTFRVNLNSPVGSPEVSSCQSYHRLRNSSQSSESSVNAIRKSVSYPTVDLSSSSSTMSSSGRNVIQCIPQSSQLTPSHASQPQMSAAINNSSNVQMGTQIVYNYFMSEPEQRNPHASSGSQSEPFGAITNRIITEPQKDYLVEFREKLISVYQKRTRSSPLPWHRGKQYYTEPQIFAVDKFGHRTSETVDLISILNSNTETRFLVEGEAGIGKTLLATKIAQEWANGTHLQQFQIVLFITLGDFKGSLQQYVREELLPSYFETEKFEKVWDYCKRHEKEILFVLDGYDELERPDKGEIQNLMKNKDFPESKVVVTSRPNFLQDWEKKIVVSGFGQLQIMEFIGKYFRAIGNENCGHSFRKIIEKDEKYWKLAKRPLFCVLLCMLYITGDVGESLPERQSDIMLQIILCLIKWNRKDSGNASIDFDSLPQEYEKPFNNFGKLCLDALKTEKSRFSDQEVHKVDGFESKLKQLGFLFNDNESHALGERKFWKPVHQTFLEYLGAFYIAKHTRECKGCKECKSYNLVFQRSHEVLKFCVGILNNKAYRVLDGERFPVLWKLPVIKILQLLREAEPKPENCQAVAKLLDQNIIEISTSEIEFEGWSYILSQPFKRLSSLKIAWRIKSKSPDQESSFTEASQQQYESFFEALKNNESIRSIHVRAKQDGEPFTEEKIKMFFTHLQNAFLKKNLQELHIVDIKMKASKYLRKAIEDVSNQPSKVRALQNLKVLKLHTFMEDDDLRGICEALGKSALSLESLHLEGLEHGRSGFQGLVNLLKGNSNIVNLNLSMNQSLFVNVFGSNETYSEDYPPTKMETEHKKMNRTAGRKSKTAFTEHSPTGAPQELNPKKELAYLFDKIPLNNGQWHLEPRHQWYLRKASSDVKIPLPLCVHREHKSVFHFLFMELPNTHIKNLTLTQAGLYLTIPDLICLGDAVRQSTHLSSINLQGLEKIESYLPLLIGLGQSESMSSVNFSSSKVSVRDPYFQVACAALEHNSSLRSISLGNWQFHLQNSKEAIQQLSKLLSSWQVTQFDLTSCLIDLDHKSLNSTNIPASPVSLPLNAFFFHPPESSASPWKSLKVLSMEGVEFNFVGFIHIKIKV